MSSLPALNGMPKKDGRVATVSVFAAVLVRIFTTLAHTYSTRSDGYVPTFRDGTDPLLGGHGAAPGDRHHRGGSRPGGAL